MFTTKFSYKKFSTFAIISVKYSQTVFAGEATRFIECRPANLAG